MLEQSQLYEDTDYKLDDIRKNKLVKPVALDLFPREIKMTKILKKKEFLYKCFTFNITGK